VLFGLSHDQLKALEWHDWPAASLNRPSHINLSQEVTVVTFRSRAQTHNNPHPTSTQPLSLHLLSLPTLNTLHCALIQDDYRSKSTSRSAAPRGRKARLPSPICFSQRPVIRHHADFAPRNSVRGMRIVLEFVLMDGIDPTAARHSSRGSVSRQSAMMVRLVNI
jgi:hypothetical protein